MTDGDRVPDAMERLNVLLQLSYAFRAERDLIKHDVLPPYLQLPSVVSIGQVYIFCSKGIL